MEEKEEGNPQCIVLFYKQDKIDRVTIEYDDRFVCKKLDEKTEEILSVNTIKKHIKTDRATMYDLETKLYSIFDCCFSMDMPKYEEDSEFDSLFEKSHKFDEDMFNSLPLASKYKKELYDELCSDKGIKPIKSKVISKKENHLYNSWLKPTAY